MLKQLVGLPKEHRENRRSNYWLHRFDGGAVECRGNADEMIQAGSGTSIVSDATDDGPPVAGDVRAPAPIVFGPLSEFAEGITELEVPRRVFVVVDGADVSAFDRKDPNNGCTLFALDDELIVELGIEHDEARFAEPCHGSSYDIAGRPLHCADARPMRSIEVLVEDGIATWGRMAIDSAAPPLSTSPCADAVEH